MKCLSIWWPQLHDTVKELNTDPVNTSMECQMPTEIIAKNTNIETKIPWNSEEIYQDGLENQHSFFW